ncbi:MAG TPA: proteasome-type protease [Pelomicrobium sp.]|nr:proteasome-type protease [Pelomicrobium sp.]
MTYCAAILLDAGLVMASDSRTNAGVDQISSYRKTTVFEKPGDRVIVLLNSGNLAVTQGVVNMLSSQARHTEGPPNLLTVESMTEAAALVGAALREVHQRDGPYLTQHNIDARASFIVAGQIRGERPRLFLVYTEGNYIEATEDTPYFQIGETKYGKPIIDRVVTPQTPLIEAAKCLLVSFDSTMRSNISVGLPIDLLIYERDTLRVGLSRRITEADPYYQMVHTQWASGLRQVFAQLPNPDWSYTQPT